MTFIISSVKNKIAFYSTIRNTIADYYNNNSIKGERKQHSDFISIRHLSFEDRCCSGLHCEDSLGVRNFCSS